MNKKSNKNCPFYDKCSVRLHPFSANDSPNMVAHLGFRCFYTVLAWIVLGYKVNEGFFLSMCFFVLPVFMDCLKFTPLNEIRKLVRNCELCVSGLLFGVSLLGVIGIYELKKVDGAWTIYLTDFAGYLPSDIELGTMWMLLILVVFVTLIDWFCNDVNFSSLKQK